MNRRYIPVCLILSLCLPSIAVRGQENNWRADRTGTADPTVAPIGSEGRTRLEQSGQLQSDQGQVWREYDIRSFTRRLRDQEKPEQAIVDWVLRETGTNTWFGQPMSVLSANRERVRVYHTPEIQDIVQRVIDRFLNTRSEANEVALRLVTVDDPNWRIKAQPMLKPIATQNPSIEAWLLSRENAALLLYELEKRADFQEHNSPNLTIYSGQSHTLKNTRPRTYHKGAAGRLDAVRDLTKVGTVDEGFTLQISPLISQDGQTMDAVIRCGVDQIEGFTPLWMEGVDRFGVRQRTQLQIPQVSSWRLHERFRWPTDEVLLISRGLVATPGPTSRWTGSLRKVFEGGAARADALLFLESRSEVRSANRNSRMASRTDPANYRGRY